MIRSYIAAVALAALVVGGCTTQPNPRADKVGETVVGQALARGRDAVCMDHLKQIRASIQMAQGAGDQQPETMTELRLPQQMLKCPVGAEAYTYDPTTGTVKCPHPGHGKY